MIICNMLNIFDSRADKDRARILERCLTLNSV